MTVLRVTPDELSQETRGRMMPRDGPLLTLVALTGRKTIARSYRNSHLETVTEYGRRYADAHRDKINEQSRVYRLTHAEQVSATKKRWYNEHLHEQRERSRNYYRVHAERDREKRRQQNRRYHLLHPEKTREHVLRRRARKYSLPATFTKDDWKHALEYFHGGCAYCGNPPSLFDVYTVLHREHYIPARKGGGYTPDNIIPACQRCNHEKGTQDARIWLAIRFGERKARQIQAKIQDYFRSLEDHDP